MWETSRESRLLTASDFDRHIGGTTTEITINGKCINDLISSGLRTERDNNAAPVASTINKKKLLIWNI